MHLRRFVIVFVLVLGASQLVPNVLRAAGARPQGSGIKQSVLASFSVRDDSGCVTTSIFVSANSERGIAPSVDDPSLPGAQIALTRSNTCEKRLLLAASGAVAFTGGELDVKGNPRSARLVVDIPATDAATGSVVNTRVDLTWHGIDPVARGSGSPGPPQANAPRVRTRYREATLTGTVLDGTTAFAPGPAAVASMTTAIARPVGAGSRSTEAKRSSLGIGGIASIGARLSALSGSLVDSPCSVNDGVGQEQ